MCELGRKMLSEHNKKKEEYIRSELMRLRTHRMNVTAYTTIMSYKYVHPTITIEDRIGLRRIKPIGWVCPLP